MTNKQLEEGQIVLCTVEKVIGTTVFVKIDGNGEGTITTSEIAPGRIRNLRNYVVPNKKIVCKILNLKSGRIHLSLRRVKQYERKELLDKIKKEKNYKAILRTVLGKEESEEIVKKISETQNIADFFEEIKKDSKILEKYFTKEQTEKIIRIIETKKDKPKELKQIFRISNKSSDGIVIVKEIIQTAISGTNADVSYISAGKYSIKIHGKDFKEIKIQINQIIELIEKQAKKNNCEFSVEK